MAKFKKGDRVKNMERDWESVPYGELGTVNENNSGIPFVLWDNYDELAQHEEYLELVTEEEPIKSPTKLASDIAQVIEQSKLNSWDDSVEINESMDLPVDKFSFSYADQYGRDLTHKLQLTEGQYDLCDIIASFRLYLFAIGYDREDVDEIIDESRL